MSTRKSSGAVKWVDSGMSSGQLVDEYINQMKSLSDICRDHNILPGCSGSGEMSATLKKAGYTIRDSNTESNRKRKITKDTMENRWGISWDELVGWYNARKPLSALCAKHGLSPIGKTTTMNRVLRENGVLTDDPLRGFGFDEKELLKMYVDEKISIWAISRKFNLSRNAGTVMAAVLRKNGCAFGLKKECDGGAIYTSSDGYTRIMVNEENKHLTNIRLGGTEMEHRMVVATSLGRPLERHEYIHHINRDCTDNRLSNLMLVDRSTHKRIHVSMDNIIEELFKEGIVAMSKDKEYALRESDEYTRGFADGMQAILEMD